MITLVPGIILAEEDCIGTMKYSSWSYKIGLFEFVSDIFVGVEVKMFVDEVGLLMNIKTVSCTVRGLFYVFYVLLVKEEL